MAHRDEAIADFGSVVLVLPSTSTGTRRALNLLYCQPPMTAEAFAAKMWPVRFRTVDGGYGGRSKYAGLMMLGRLRKVGYVEVAPGDGASMWRLTMAGKRMCRPVRSLFDPTADLQ